MRQSVVGRRRVEGGVEEGDGLDSIAVEFFKNVEEPR